MLSYGSLKGYVDGALGSHSAAFFEPYCDTPIYSGDTVNSTEQLHKWISESDKSDLQVFIHAIGDRAINIILNVFEQVIQENGVKDRRWRIEHSQHIQPSDIPRFKTLGVMASVQPYHAIDDSRFCQHYLGSDRLNGTYAFNSLLKNGAVCAFGSDWFVSPPEPLV